jgi:hypothetical protein
MPALSASKETPASFNFMIEVVGFDVSKDQFEDALFEAGLSDALVLVQGKRLFLDVDREAVSYEKAVASAKDDVMRAGGDVIEVRRITDND